MQEQIQGFSLSPQQKRLWLLQKESQAYQAHCAILLEGNLKKEVLKEALNQIVNRHEILRTTFHCINGVKTPIQVINEDTLISLNEAYFEDKDPIEFEIEKLFQSASQQSLDLEQGSLLLATLVTLTPQKHLLVVSLPALYADAPTLDNLVCELSRCYAACLEHEKLSEQPLQYADISEWQNELLQTEELKAESNYWRKFDVFNIGELKLPYSNQLINNSEFQPQSLSFDIPPDLVTKIDVALAKHTNITSYVFFLTCWQILLCQLTGKSDTIIGIASNGRNYEQLQEALGLLVKYLPFQCNLQNNYKFSDLLNIVTEATEEIFECQESFSWENSVSTLNGNSQQQSFFPFCFEFTSLSAKYYADSICFSTYKQYACVDKFQVKLSCVRRDDDRIAAEFHYDANVYVVEDIQRLASQFETLLASVVKNLEGAIASFDILSPLEREQLLVDNNTKTATPQHQCIHHWFESQCDRTPDNIAVVCENQQLTYSELNAQANQLAHYLQKMGVGPEIIVGICTERSLDMVVGVLGILKAGGAYLPLDPIYPKERLAFILEETCTPVLLTQQKLLSILPECSAELCCLDYEWEKIALESTQNPISKTISDNLAYVIYTSGSTGKPKGTLIPHQGLVNYLTWCTQAYAVDLGEGATVHSTLAFDLTITGLFSPLVVGRRVELIPEDQSMESLGNALRNGSNYSLVKITPAQLQLLEKHLSSSEVAGKTRALIIGGENLLAESITFWQNFAPNTILVNEYGPTETVVGCCIYQVPKGEMLSGSVPIGHAIANTELYVLNQYHKPVPIGVPGELYIGGLGLARGYFNRSELTAEKFIPNPFSEQPGARLYKTGDLVCYRLDGNLEFLGRIDNQVKVRGFRIELGEIEGLLKQHPGVRETIVMAREDVPGDQRLVAYVVSKSDATPIPSELRSYLKQHLPEYMLPSAFVLMDALPLTTNGKVDRRALPAPDQTRPELQETFVAPTTAIEEILAGIWAQILGLEKVGIHNNFFELGGHSLLATQVISQVRKVFQQELSLRRLFEQPTIAGLAKDIEKATKAGLGLETVTIERISRSQKLLLSFAQQRLWFLAQLEPNNPFYNVHGAVRLQGQFNLGGLQQSFNEILHRHEALRTNFQTIEGQAVAVISSATSLLLPVFDLSELPLNQREAEFKKLADFEAQQPFDLNSDLLLRVKLLRLDKQEHIVLLTMHHIVSDGWSIGVLVSELATLYQAFCAGQPSPLAELPIQYVDFAAWQRQWLQAEVVQSQLSYWKKQLEGAPTLLELPTDHPRPAVQTFTGATYSFELSVELSQALNKLSQQQGSTLFMTLLAAFQTLLWRYTGQEDIVVGSPIANRNRAEIEGLIGFFVNTLVLRTNLANNPTFGELLTRVREVALGAYAHQDLPFEQLVEELQPQRDLSYMPLCQVEFILQNTPMSALELSGLSLSLLESNSGTAKFDLTLDMTETAQGLVGTLQYNTDLFEENTISRMAGHIQTLLEGIVANPQQRVSELPLFTQAEKALLAEWNHTEIEYPQEKCIHQLFEAQVEQTPNAVAVVFEDQQLTYSELNRRANQLAHYLQKLGVGTEILVGICTERSLDMIVGLLGILKAAGAYVPLDPGYPKERLAFMLENSQPSVLLTQQHLVESLPTHRANVVCLDSNWELIAQQRIENPESNITADNLAYVIYTSGSTGRPKGAMNTHRGICNRLLWMQDAYQLTATDKVLQKTPFSFDVSVWEFFWPLITGARLVIAQPEGHRDTNYLVDFITQQQVTTLHFVPSMLQVFLEAENIETCKCLKRVIASGEVLPVQLQKRFFNCLDAELHNLYGPTEAGVDVTYWACVYQSSPENNSITHKNTVPIGHPIANIQIYLLDQYLNPVTVGVTGEVYIGGIGVGRGYLNRPELTAEKFIPNPFTDKSASRLYKTGDLARYLPNGEIEYIGRIDHQVKIRGFRIELGEIEALLNEHPGLQQAVVLAQEEQPGNKRLVAYVVQNLQYQNLKELVSETAWQNEKISQWEVVFEQSYADISQHQDPTFNISGWNSSYTNLPIPAAEMREWVDHTVDRILALQPSRVLEIGCGTGLLLFRVAPHCTHYWGTDISSVALNQIQQQLIIQEQKLPQVKLFQKKAEDLENVEAEAFDMVILNSVVQYFPNINYLLHVLEGAVRAVEPGGFIFVGDVRSLPLLEAFHASVELAQASASLSRNKLQQRVQKDIAQEQELVVDPAFFIALKQHLPQITHVQIQPKRGHYHNELTKFRYDVILHVGNSEVYSTPEFFCLDWEQQRLTLSSVRQLLEETEPEILGIARIPNARLLAEVKTVELLKSDSLDTSGDIAKALQKIVPADGVDPEDLWGLSEGLPYTIDLNWSSCGVDGSYDALFKRRTTKTVVSFPGEIAPLKPWSSYTNNPLQWKFASELVPQLRTFLQTKLPDYMVPTAFVMLDALPLTPNGKLDRKALPATDRIRPELEKAFIAPQTTVEKQLADIWTQVLGLEKVGINDNFFELGGDSILSVQITFKANQAGLHLTTKQLFEHQTIAQLATVAGTTKTIQAEQGAVTGTVPLTPIQHWFFEQEQPEPHHWNQAVLLEVKQGFDPALLEQVVQSLQSHHDALRLRFIEEEFGIQVVIASPDHVVPLTQLDLSALPKEEQAATMKAMADQLQASLNLSVGPLFRVALFDFGSDKPYRLLWVIHHLIVDGVSWRILLDDFQTAYQQLSQGKTIQLPLKTTSFKHWSQRLQEYAQSSYLRCELDYWLTTRRQPVKLLPIDYPRENNTQATASTVSVSLSVEETQVLLQQVPVAYQTQINDILLTALTQTFAQWTGESSLLVDLEGHGREELFDDLDLSRTVGWFTSMFPVHLSLENASSPRKALMAIKEQLRLIPNRGIGYGVLHYLSKNQEITEQLNSLPKAEVIFNYLGQFDQVLAELSLFGLTDESSGSACSLRSKRTHLLEINGGISQGRLQINWTYNEKLHRQTTVEGLAQGFIEALRSLIAHCLSPDAGDFTPSDFAQFEQSQWSQADLDAITAAIGDI